MKHESIWKEDFQSTEEKRFEKDFSVDILIIGGGLSGLSTAFHLLNTKKINLKKLKKNKQNLLQLKFKLHQAKL